MKKLIILSLLTFVFTTSLAQSEPEKIDTKDMVETVDRSDLENDTDTKDELNSMITTFEIPKIEFESKENPKKKPTKKKNSNKVKSEKIIESTDEKKATVVKLKPKRKSAVVIAKFPLTVSQFKRNDKIVLSKGKVYVYRLAKSNIVQYKYKGKLAMNSEGIKKNSENSYYIIDRNKFIKDIKELKKNKTHKPKKKKKEKEVKIEKREEDIGVTEEILLKRKKVEDRLNHGKTIKKSLLLKDLRKEDEVYLIGKIQLVIRKNKATSGVKKYWLLEKFDITNKSVIKVSKNKYKINRKYL
jgi:hypothetical protein